ncbi:hypothetical protein [Sulfurisphaera ohwakuensis]|uniref:Uncharacterized protein n=1 Tax=Sulfurisphaera ohwakuensis TaxID=69656 RepID=A0A650CKU3_SULOH|nr:hypothetical protein [Sulfurisphaera ohwakuensis]MBB5253674.1 hypothetical protein [Sulfurisphaera ohwakuensis]QGR18343.1 hypothetical protein D1869_14940 [Sulfurisphaera ohwakuensis]
MGRKKLVIFITALFFLFLYFSLFPPGLFSNIIAPIIFWIMTLFITLFYPLNTVFTYVMANFKRKKEISISTLMYFPFHLLIFSLALEKLLTLFFNYSPTFYHGEVNLAFSPFVTSGLGFLFNLLFNPSIEVLLPPYYFLSITPFAIFIALSITFLVSANIGKIFEFIRSKRLIAGVISLGLVGGSTCCLSLPTIIAFYTPLSFLAYNVISGEILTIVYFALPLIVIFSLYDLFKRSLKVKCDCK